MATTVTSVSLTSTITESITLNGESFGNTNTKTTVTQGEVYQRIMSIATTETTVLTFGTADASGTVVGDDMSYFRVTNLDDTNFVQISFKGAAKHYSVKLDPQDSYVIMSNQFNAEADTSIGSMEDLASFTAVANGTACDLEVFVVTT